MIVIDSFLNLLNAAIGRKQDFEQLVQSGDISRVLASMESKAEETAIARREYDPKKHLINRREDKIILDKDGNLKRKIKRWKLSSLHQRDRTCVHLRTASQVGYGIREYRQSVQGFH